MAEKKKYSIKDGYMSIHEILAVNGVRQRRLIDEIEKEEQIEGRENPDMIEADIKSMKIKTDLAKGRFINELKSGLGSEIKENPNKIKINRPSLLKRIRNWINKLFTKF